MQRLQDVKAHPDLPEKHEKPQKELLLPFALRKNIFQQRWE
jgi:hypothetical protein